MESILIIAQIILLFALAGLAVYLILVLGKVRDILGIVEKNLGDVVTKTIPVLENLEVITTRLRVIIENVDEQITGLNKSVEAIKGVADNIAAFERKVQDSIEGPILEVMNTLGGIIKGFTSFFSRSKRAPEFDE